MALKNLVGTVARTGVSTAVAAVRDPLGTASLAVGVVKQTADAGIGLVRGRIGDPAVPTPRESEKTSTEDAPEFTATAADEQVADEQVEDEPREDEQAEDPAASRPDTTADTAAADTAVAEQADKDEESDDPRDHIPGPDLAAFPPPAPEDLPEPIVIEAE